MKAIVTIIGLWLPLGNTDIGFIYFPFTFIAFNEDKEMVFYNDDGSVFESSAYSFDGRVINTGRFIFQDLQPIDSNNILLNISINNKNRNKDPDSIENKKAKTLILKKVLPTEISIDSGKTVDTVLRSNWESEKEFKLFFGDKLSLLDDQDTTRTYTFSYYKLKDSYILVRKKNKMIYDVFPVISINNDALTVFAPALQNVFTLRRYP